MKRTTVLVFVRTTLLLLVIVLPALAQQSPPSDHELVDSRGCGPGRDGKTFCTNDTTVWIAGDLPYSHSTCRVFFDVVWADEHKRPIGPFDYWPEGWNKWWRGKKGQEKYVDFCYEPNPKRAHYVIFWSEHTVQGTRYLPQEHQATTEISGDISATVKTTWWESAPVPYAATYINVWMARSSDIAPALAANRDPTIYQSAAKGKNSLEGAFKVIADQNSLTGKRKP